MITLLECTDREVLCAGPAGTGKSRACLEKIHLMALMFPGMRGLIARKTQKSLTNSALVTFRDHVIPEAVRDKEVSWYGGSQQEPAQYRYANGSIITIAGMDDAEKIKSSEFDVIYVQEATELALVDWNTLGSRLRNFRIPHFQQLMADCNPVDPMHWIKRRCNEGKTYLLESRHEENPRLYTEAGELTHEGREYMARLDNLSGLEYQRLRLGRWVGAEGIVYGDFDSVVHVIEPIEIGDDWARYWVVDFGTAHPFVCQWWAEDPDGILYLYREWYKTEWKVEDHARRMLSLVTRPARDDDPEAKVHKVGEGVNERRLVFTEPKPRAILCDHDRGARKTLEYHLNLTTVPALKDVERGIQAVGERLKSRRLFIFSDATVERDPLQENAMNPTGLVEELPGYVWDRGKGKGDKEQPVKEKDDGCDCLRYMVAERDLRARPSVRWLQ